MHNVKGAFLRLQSDLDPLMKLLIAPGQNADDVKPSQKQEKTAMRRVQSAEDIQATNRIISHVLRKVLLLNLAHAYLAHCQSIWLVILFLHQSASFAPHNLSCC